MTQTSQSFRFDGLAHRPVPSILRGFSAPVILQRDTTRTERAFLLAHDSDPFNKWEAGRALAKDVLSHMVTEGAPVSQHWLEALAQVLRDENLDPAFRALALRLPTEDDMAQTLSAAGHTPDPARIHTARRAMGLALAQHLAPELAPLRAALANAGPYDADAAAAGRRALSLALLALTSRLDGGAAATALSTKADNMTEELGALACLLEIGQAAEALKRFEARWHDNRLVMDNWFMLQILHAAPDQTAATVEQLTRHPAFDWKNPNRFRAVIGALAANHAGFHHTGGAGYQLAADWLLRLDPANPQTAARMSTAFETWPRYDAQRQSLLRAQLSRILATPDLSRDLGEMAGRMLG